MVSKTLQQLLLRAISQEGITPEITWRLPAGRQGIQFGDYATNVAFAIDNKHAHTAAKGIASALLALPYAKHMIEKAEVAGGGFINITLAMPYMKQAVWDRAAEEVRMESVAGSERISIEALSANPTGKYHVGNGRTAFFGDVLARVLLRVGHEVTREYYINNARVSVQIRELGKTALGRGEKYKTPYVEEKIHELRDVLSRVDEEGEAGYLVAGRIVEEQKTFLEERAGLKYDLWTEEEELYLRGLPDYLFSELMGRGLVYEQGGAQWLKTTEFDDDKDKVLRRSDGTFGYYMADIAYHKDKIDRGYQRIIDVFGADHHGHVVPLEVAMDLLGYSGQFKVLLAQLVRVRGGRRLSKREGTLVYLDELIDEAGIDAVRFFYLMRSLSSQMEFDVALAKEQSQKNPVYYVQYTHARTHGILKNNAGGPMPRSAGDLKAICEPEERLLMKTLLQYEDIVHEVAYTYNVHYLPEYAQELATVFNAFYEKHYVLSDKEDVRRGRVALVLATQHVLADCLGLMGISAPETM